MTAISGRFGAIDGISQVANWNVESTISDTAQANSYTYAAMARHDGIRSWSGSCNFLGNVLPGNLDSFQFRGYCGNGRFQGEGTLYSGTAVMTGVSISADMTTHQRVTTSLQFAGSGPFEKSTGSYTDSASPAIIRPKELSITIGGETVVWKNFSFSANQSTQTYVASDCVHDGDVWQVTVPAILDANFSVLIPGSEELWETQNFYPITVNWNGTPILELGYAVYLGMSGLTADPSSGALLEHTDNFGFSAHDGTGNRGKLTLFGSDWYPPTT